MSNQLSLENEPGWPKTPEQLKDQPTLELCWRGLVISITSDQISKEAAYAMLKRWDQAEQGTADSGL